MKKNNRQKWKTKISFFGKKEKQKKSVSNIYGKTWNIEFFIFVSHFSSLVALAL